MRTAIKTKIPLLFLIAISLWWAFYYQSNSVLNDYGSANYEWLYFIDALIVLPILCFVCVKNKKEALLKAIVLCSIAVLVGSFIIPQTSKLVWPYLEQGRYFILAALLLLELSVLLTVYVSIKAALKQDIDPDLAVAEPIQRYLGDGIVGKVFSFETRMWTYALFASRIKTEHFTGEQHFTYHQKDGAQSNLLGFIFLITVELPIAHILLHFFWSPLAANIITALTLFSLVFFIAEYRAYGKRPISLTANALIIRYGIYQPLVIPLSKIAAVKPHTSYVKRAKHVKRFNSSGVPNIAIDLKPSTDGQDHVIQTLYLGIDKPQVFLNELNARLTP